MSRACKDDCYYYYAGTCIRGDACQYRHCEAAKQTVNVCKLWKEGRCFRQICAYRHSETPKVQKDRSKIPCFWENQAGGCRKPICPFMHTKPRNDKGTILSEEEMLATVTSPPPDMFMPMASEEEAVAKMYMSPPLLPQDTSSNVHSPKVEQLVINPFEEESDGDSVQGTPVKDGINQRIQQLKMPQQPFRTVATGQPDRQRTLREINPESLSQTVTLGTSNIAEPETNLNFGVKSLEEIRQDKLERAKKLMEEADSLLRLTQQLSPEHEEAPAVVEQNTPVIPKPGVKRVRKVLKMDKKTALKIRDALQSSSSQKVTLRPIQGQVKKKPTTPPVSEEQTKVPPITRSKSPPDAGRTKLPASTGRTKSPASTGRTKSPAAQVRARRKSSASSKKQEEKSQVAAPIKTVVKVNAKPPSRDQEEVDVGVKSLEEIWREKALASLRRAQEKKRLEAENEKPKAADSQPVRRSVKQPTRQSHKQPDKRPDKRPDKQPEIQADRREVHSARRIVVKQGDQSPPQTTTKSTIKGRLGTRNVEERSNTRKVEDRQGVKNRLGVTDASQKESSEPTRRTVRSRLGVQQQPENPTQRRVKAKRHSDVESDVDSDVSLRSNDSLLQSEHSDSAESTHSGDVTRVEIKSLKEIRRERALASLKGQEEKRQSMSESENEIEHKQVASVATKRKVKRADSDDTDPSPPKMRKPDLELQKKKPTRKVTIQRGDSSEEIKPPSRKISPVKMSAKSRLGVVKTATKLDSIKGAIGITRTLKVQRGESDERKTEIVESQERKIVDSNGVSAEIGGRKRRIKEWAENKASKREPRVQLYRPPGAKKQFDGESSRKSSPVPFEELEESKPEIQLARKPIRNVKPVETVRLPKNAPAPSSKDWAEVKTFSEILREKELRKQQELEKRNAPTEDKSSDNDAVILEESKRNLKRSISPVVQRDTNYKETGAKLIKQSPIFVDKSPLRPFHGSKRIIRRNVWSTRDDAPGAGSTELNTRKLNKSDETFEISKSIKHKITSDKVLGNTKASSIDSSQALFGNKLTIDSNRVLFGKKPTIDHSNHTLFGKSTESTPVLFGKKVTKPITEQKTRISALKSNTKLTGRSPFLRNKVETEGLHITPISLKSDAATVRNKQRTAAQIDPLEIPVTPIGLKSQPLFGKQPSTDNALRVHIPKSAAAVSKEPTLRSPAVSPPVRSPKVSPHSSRRSSVSSTGRAHSLASAHKSEKPDHDDDLLDELLELADGEASMELGIGPDDDALLLEMKELLGN